MGDDGVVIDGQDGVPVRQSRAAMMLTVKCSMAGESTVSLRVRNLSETGLGGVLLEAATLTVGEPVKLAFRTFGPIPARIVWRSAERVGFAFDKQVDLQKIAVAKDWNGPTFDVADKHQIAEKCWRPGWQG